eukprot:TRINITY_DN124837_c0_g1_i1.p1 TRINITY_DN124837_c0_g1~~TRINITY_DN124837_c0_g1_i1.p1  ORF type:complete len:256 (-),score=47.29 TRINITY_DN124837_c0_g1_i1:327-1094(-)
MAFFELQTLLPTDDVLTLVAYQTLSSCVQTMAGFGGGLMMMPLGMRLLPAVDLIAAIWGPNQALNIGLALSDRKHVQVELLMQRILPWMGVGLVAGMYLARVVSGDFLKKGLGFFIILVSSTKLYQLTLKGSAPAKKTQTDHVPLIGLLAAGFIHGMYSTGGPPLVWAVGSANLDRDAFRGTMAAVWICISMVQLGGLIVQGSFQVAHVVLGLCLVPGLLAGSKLGNFLRSLMPEMELHIFINILLAASGASLLK